MGGGGELRIEIVSLAVERKTTVRRRVRDYQYNRWIELGHGKGREEETARTWMYEIVASPHI